MDDEQQTPPSVWLTGESFAGFFVLCFAGKTLLELIDYSIRENSILSSRLRNMGFEPDGLGVRSWVTLKQYSLFLLLCCIAIILASRVRRRNKHSETHNTIDAD